MNKRNLLHLVLAGIVISSLAILTASAVSSPQRDQNYPNDQIAAHYPTPYQGDGGCIFRQGVPYAYPSPNGR